MLIETLVRYHYLSIRIKKTICTKHWQGYGATAVENAKWYSYIRKQYASSSNKVKYSLNAWPSNSTPMHLPGRTERLKTYTWTFRLAPNQKRPQCASVDDVWCTRRIEHNWTIRVLLWNMMCKNMDESHNPSAKWKNPARKGYTLYHSIHIIFWKRPHDKGRKQISSCQRLGVVVRGFTEKGHEGLYRETEMFCALIMAVLIQLSTFFKSHQIVRSKSWIYCRLCLNKTDFLKKGYSLDIKITNAHILGPRVSISRNISTDTLEHVE